MNNATNETAAKTRAARTTCPCCRRRFVLNSGNLPEHVGRYGDSCSGADLPLWAATSQALHEQAVRDDDAG